MKIDSFEIKLIEIGYNDLFRYGNKSEVYTIWEEGKNQHLIEAVIQDNNSSYHGKFLATEVLRRFEVDVQPEYYMILAEAYAYALSRTSMEREDFIGLNGNAWGLLYEANHIGYLGKQFIKFDRVAILPLTKLLEDSNDHILYEGSQEATMGNSYQYRIKDIAAFYLSKITNIPIQFYQDFEKRDAEIERLKLLMEAE